MGALLATVIRTEVRKRGIIGKVFLLLFWLFNALMGFSLWAGLSRNGERLASLASDAERTGHMAGTALGAGMIVIIWAAGAVILGLLVLLTPGRTIVTETTKD
jgi:UPF0716 family protein affecting phage T7 exclusion